MIIVITVLLMIDIHFMPVHVCVIYFMMKTAVIVRCTLSIDIKSHLSQEKRSSILDNGHTQELLLW